MRPEQEGTHCRGRRLPIGERDKRVGDLIRSTDQIEVSSNHLDHGPPEHGGGSCVGPVDLAQKYVAADGLRPVLRHRHRRIEVGKWNPREIFQDSPPTISVGYEHRHGVRAEPIGPRRQNTVLGDFTQHGPEVTRSEVCLAFCRRHSRIDEQELSRRGIETCGDGGKERTRTAVAYEDDITGCSNGVSDRSYATLPAADQRNLGKQGDDDLLPLSGEFLGNPRPGDRTDERAVNENESVAHSGRPSRSRRFATSQRWWVTS